MSNNCPHSRLPSDPQSAEQSTRFGSVDSENSKAPKSDNDDFQTKGDSARMACGQGTCHAPTTELLTLYSEMLEAMKQIRDGQQRIEALLIRRNDPNHDINSIAQELWVNGEDAWKNSPWANELPVCRVLGRKFLDTLAPNGYSDFWSKFVTRNVRTESSEFISRELNILGAREVFRNWVQGYHLYGPPWSDQFLANRETLKRRILNSGDFSWWPKEWKRSPKIDIRIRVPGPLIKDPFNNGPGWPESNSLLSAASARSSFPGIVTEIPIVLFPGVIDFDTIATIICLSQRALGSTDEDTWFLRNYVSKWREQRVDVRCAMGCFETFETLPLLRDRPSDLFHFGRLIHNMQSFVVIPGHRASEVNLSDGLQCQRESLQIKGFYGDEIIHLAERRYSAVLNFLPLGHPCGYFTLLSLIDCHNERHGNNSVLKYYDKSNEANPWTRYGILPAGLYSGVSVFQLQLCNFIDHWELDWNRTMANIDKLISLKVDVLKNNNRLNKLVLQTKSDISVLYFKVLHTLGLLIDSVRAAPQSLDSLAVHFQMMFVTQDILGYRQLHAQETERLIAYNWNIVVKRQNDAAEKVLAKLERTRSEVKSLQDGLFNVQSVTEAQKSRALNKYLFVFTFFTILFLPPTFVATFFGNSLFNSPSANDTPPQTSSSSDDSNIRRKFWIIFAGLSAATYIIAGLMLFGTNVPGERWKSWGKTGGEVIDKMASSTKSHYSAAIRREGMPEESEKESGTAWTPRFPRFRYGKRRTEAENGADRA